MLFNSVHFLMFFLPISLVLFFAIGRFDGRLGKVILAILSLAFYGYWDYRFLPLLFGSICINYLCGLYIAEANVRRDMSKAYFSAALGVIFNLGLLGFFKYANLFAESADTWFGVSLSIPHIILPIGISFYTFTQIAFLVDVYQNKANETSFWDYVLFVSYFPHQIAGPILHHKEMMSQFRAMCHVRWSAQLFGVGLSILVIGLAKKVLIADPVSDFVVPVFSAAESDGQLQFFEAWFGALAYALQLYFDFSGYCDMAVGISLMFGIRLPANFDSPYKSKSIIEFWRRWHITLSRFLRDYLYISLGGNRLGKWRRYINLIITMGLGGLWHGASWTFLFWGLLHGGYLVINHLWRGYVAPTLGSGLERSKLWMSLCWALTFVSVLVAWVFFKAETFHGAFSILRAMLGVDGVAFSPKLEGLFHFVPGVTFRSDWLGGGSGGQVCAILFALTAVCLFAPNTQEIFRKYEPVLENDSASEVDDIRSTPLQWRPSAVWSIALAIVMAIVISRLGNDSQFLYFNF